MEELNLKINKYKIILIILTLLIIFLLFKLIINNNNKNLTIGYQTITAQTWSAILIKNFNLIEKNYKKEIKINWRNFASGPPITNNMISGKIDIGFMGDMPLIINGDLGQKNKYYDSILIGFDGKGINGENQEIITKKASNIKEARDLIGKKVSTPNSSSAHRNLIQEIDLAEIEESSINILFQDIPTAILLFKKGEIDAISVWEPYSSYLIQENNFIKIKKKNKNKYLAGVVANKKFIEKNEEIKKAFILALIDAHNLMKEGSPKTIKLIAEESGFSETIVKNVIKNILWEHEIKEDDIDVMEKNSLFLKKINKISPNFNIYEFIK